jgi:CubicO group peptidase (beta-lactamase class C family)
MSEAAWSARFERWAEPLVRRAEAPGVIVAVGERGRMTYAHGFGHRDREAGLPITPDTMFGIGSVTKSFTAVAILQLQEQGRLSIDDPVVRHIPELAVPNAHGDPPMRIHHLLTHSSGLPPLPTLVPAMLTSLRQDEAVAREMGLPTELLRDGQAIDSPEEMVRYLNALDIRPLGRPGEVFSYSNDGYALLGMIVERVSGQPYGDYLAEHVLGPAGMGRTGLVEAAPGDPDASVLYARRRREGEGGAEGEGEVVRSPLWWQSSAMAAAGFLRSTAADLLRYLEIFRTGGTVDGVRLLREESVRAMTARHIACDLDQWYGYGLMVSAHQAGVTLVEHGGSIKGVAAQILLVPERGLTVAVLANLAGTPSLRLAIGAVNAYLGLEDVGTPRISPPDYAGPAEDLEELVGRYASEEGAQCEVSREGDHLVLTSGGERLPARRIGARRFLIVYHEEPMGVEFRPVGGQAAMTFGLRVLRRVEPQATEA